LKAGAVRLRIDFDHDLFDSSARRLAATNRFHRNEASDTTNEIAKVTGNCDALRRLSRYKSPSPAV
jgi:hypothetical protein